MQLVSPVTEFPPADTPAPHSPYTTNMTIMLDAWLQASSHHGINLPFHHKLQNWNERTEAERVWKQSLLCPVLPVGGGGGDKNPSTNCFWLLLVRIHPCRKSHFCSAQQGSH